MKEYRENGSKIPRIFILGTRWKATGHVPVPAALPPMSNNYICEGYYFLNY
jgi:hypothetical protein